jgi:cysteine synthase A
MTTIHNSILETIGNTPIVRINNLGPRHVNLFAKIESFNPMGSVKDRLALGIIEDAERRGELQPGQTVVEATSGNTGIGLAMVCAQKGYPLVIVMAENFSVERRKIIRFMGAKVVLTPASGKGSGMLEKASELAQKHGWWQPKQFENPVNADIHAQTTAVEILRAFSDRKLDYWVSGFGTGGTFSGVSRVLREQSAETKIMVCEPDNAQMVGGKRPQPRDEHGAPSASHPDFRPHLMQGWSTDFIPTLVQDAVDKDCFDDTVPVDGAYSLQCAKDLAQKEGIFVGISAGATFAGALMIAELAPEGSNILCMLPDTGERYMSTPLFDGIEESMSAEESEISQSTDGFRFDKSVAAKKQHGDERIDDSAMADVQALINDPEKPTVMFGLEWCEFCWSVRKVMKEYGIECRYVDLDAVKYQSENMGTKMRLALRSVTGWNTFPQIFVKGEFIGGCTDLFNVLADRSLLPRLEEKGIAYHPDVSMDPYTKLPGWLHPRL